LGAPEDPALRDPELALLSSACDDLADLLREVAADLAALGVPVEGVVSDGQHSIRLAIARVWPDIPHQLCHFHYLREAARVVQGYCAAVRGALTDDGRPPLEAAGLRLHLGARYNEQMQKMVSTANRSSGSGRRGPASPSATPALESVRYDYCWS
jgi:hypothetical protein